MVLEGGEIDGCGGDAGGGIAGCADDGDGGWVDGGG